MGIFNDNDNQTGQVREPQIIRGGGSGGIFPGASEGTAGSGSSGGGGGRALVIESQGSVIATDANSINFTGSGVSATSTAQDVTVVINGTVYTGGAGITVDPNTNTISISVGGVITAMLADGSVTTVKLADNSVSTAKIVDAAVVGAKIAAGAVGNVQLADNAVTTVKIVDGAVATAKLADGSVTTIKLADNSVDSDKLTAGSVTTDKIVDDAITFAKMADDSVGVDQLRDNSVTTPKLANDAVTAPKLAQNSVTDPAILNATITGGKLAANTVANGNLVHDSITINGVTIDLGGQGRIPTGGGPTPPSDQSQLRVSATPATIVFGTGTTNCSATLTETTGFSIKSGTATLSVTDPQNNAVDVTKVSDSEFTFTLANNLRGTAHVSAEATLVRATDDSEFIHSASDTIEIDQRWYSSIRQSNPSDISVMDNLGVWTGSANRQFNTTGVAANSLFIALPTRTGGYTFKSGELFLNNTSVGTINTSWTVYRIDDFDNSQTGANLTINITEA